jgi:hypothetical protein
MTNQAVSLITDSDDITRTATAPAVDVVRINVTLVSPLIASH